MNQADFLRRMEENKGILYKIANAYCRHAGDREDLIQEMIYELWKSGERFDDHFKFSTWMYRIALNVAISFYRKASRSSLRVDFEAGLSPDLEAGLSLEVQTQTDSGEELEERIALLQRFIGELGEMDKALMILYLEEKPYREIAEILGITETNVATKLSRIRDRLKQQFLTAGHGDAGLQKNKIL
jgi:RNA polymerase sigma factor (sigma-70 family)